MTKAEIISTLESIAQFKEMLLSKQAQGVDNSEKINKCNEFIEIFTEILGEM